MAIANSDGSIILSTKVDTSGINKGMSQMQGKATSLTKTFSKLGAAIASAFAIQKIIQFSNEAGQLATQTEASVQRLVDIYGEASGAVGDFIDANARALGMSKSAAASFSSVYGNLFSAFADQATNAELTNEYLQMTAVVASKTGRTVEDVQERIRSGLLGNTEAIEDLGIFVNVKTIEMTDAFQRMAAGKSWEQLDAYTQQQIRSMAILEQATSKYGDEVAKTSSATRNNFKAAYEDFKNSWGNIVNAVLLPVMQWLTMIFDMATRVLNVFSGRNEEILGDAQSQEESAYNTAKNIEEQTENQKELNKEMKKTLAGFDDIQILSAQTAENQSGVSVLDQGLQGISNNVSTGDSNFDATNFAEQVRSALDYLAPIIELSLVAIGLILLSLGNIPLGIGFIATGAYLYSVTERSAGSFDFSVVQSDLMALSEYVEEALLVIGIILLLFGNIPFGIGFIVAGAIAYGVKEASSEEYSGEDIKTKLAIITEYVSLALAAIGVILIMFGHVPLGIGFLIVGYKVFGVSEQELDESGTETKIREFFQKNQKIFVGVGLALVVLGILLLLTPISFPIALGLIAAGAVTLATEQEINGTRIIDDIRYLLFENAALISMISGGLLIIGIILCVAGILPLGIGLIVAGAGGLAAEVALNWGTIVENIKNFLFENPTLVSLISGGLLIIGIILCVTGVGLPLGIGLIVVGAAGLATEVVLNWNSIVDNIKKFLFENSELIAMISGGLLILGIILCVTGVGIPLGIGMIIAGAVGLASVVSVNWNAIVDWVKNAWQAVKDFWNKYIAQVFTATFWLNLAKTCGNGLILGFESAVNGIIWLFEKMINFVVSGLNLFLKGVDSVISAVGNVFGQDWGVAQIPEAKLGRVSIPRLAQGAVIPPNREFLAVLGDQKKGTNIETPLSTMIEAFNVALNNRQNDMVKEEHYYLDESEIMRLIYKLAKRGERAQGDDLLESW